MRRGRWRIGVRSCIMRAAQAAAPRLAWAFRHPIPTRTTHARHPHARAHPRRRHHSRHGRAGVLAGTGTRKLDVVVLYSVMDGAAVRISSGASHMRTIGPRSTVVRQTLGFDRTDGATPGAFRLKAVVMEDGKSMGECT